MMCDNIQQYNVQLHREVRKVIAKIKSDNIRFRILTTKNIECLLITFTSPKNLLDYFKEF